MSIVKRRNNDENAPEFRALHWGAKISPRKARLVIDQVRGLPINEALDFLRFDRHRGGYLIDRVLKSAISNADQAISGGKVRGASGEILSPQPGVDVEDLYIHDARVDEGPRLKRWKPRSRGQAFPYLKYYAHITIKLRPRPVPASTRPVAGLSSTAAK